MTDRPRKVLHNVMELPLPERAEATWASEIERRAREAFANPDDDVAWETVRDELRATPTR